MIADLPPAEPPERPLDLDRAGDAGVGRRQLVGGLRPGADRIVIVVEEVRPEDFEEPDDPDQPSAADRAPLSDPRGHAAGAPHPGAGGGFIADATDLVEGGRPACPLCGNPMGEDHACPRTNGHGPPR